MLVYLSLMSNIQVFQPNGKSPLGLDNELLKMFVDHGLVTILSQLLAVFLQLLIFSSFLTFLVIFLVFLNSTAT